MLRLRALLSLRRVRPAPTVGKPGGGPGPRAKDAKRNAASVGGLNEPAEIAAPAGAEYIKKGGKIDADAIREAISREDFDADSDDESLRRVQLTLSRDLNKRLDRYLVDRITFLSRTQLQKLVETGAVLVNGRAAKASTKLRLGDVVDVTVPPPPSTEIQGEAIPIEVLYEDAGMLVLNKQPGIIVHPARSHNSGTLLNALVHYFEVQGAKGEAGGLSSVGKDLARPGVVHRLDRDTSGVMVIAKDETAHWRLGRQFETRTTDKRYLAIVEGVLETDTDVIDIPMGPSPSKAKGMREKQVVRHDELGKPAVTIYRVRQRFLPKVAMDPGRRSVGDTGFTLVELELKTGRTHQIRVHLAHLGYPIVGDDMYGGCVAVRRRAIDPELTEPDKVVLERQALHAAVLGIDHPETGARMVHTAPIPADMAELVTLLRRHGGAEPVQAPPGATVDLSDALRSVEA